MVGYMMNNQLKTIVLMGLLTAILLWLGNLFGPGGLIFAIIFVVLFNFLSYWFSDKFVLFIYRAKKAKEKDYPKLFKIVREVTQMAKIQMPKVFIIPSESPNAFATGRNPKHSSVAATKGIIELMDDDELKGVIAHEISHIKNRDILIQTIAGMIAGVISYVAAVARWGAIFGGGDREDGGNNLITLIVIGIITPIIALIIQLAISRSREYMADESAAKLLHNGNGLAVALEKLDKSIQKNPLGFGNNSTAHLFIANPFRNAGFLNMLSTHPPINERIKRLKGMKF
jgi:heat shock protein HtpX